MKPKLTQNATKVLEHRYLQKDSKGNIVETPEQMFRRVAKVVASIEKKEDRAKWEERFYEMMCSLEFLGNSPILMNAGATKGTLSACFVIKVEDTMDSIMDMAKAWAMIFKYGGGVGASFSNLRPKGDPISTTHGKAAGPVAVLKHYASVTEMVTQGGKRHGASMGLLRVDHPDIEEFITCKHEEGVIKTFNISVGITDDFMEALQDGEAYNIIHPVTGKTISKKKAKDIWDMIVASAHSNGEPGVYFVDRVNKYNPTPQLGVIEAPNPCLAGSSYLLIALDGGDIVLEHISDLRDKAITMWNGKHWVTAIVFKSGIKPLKTLTLSNGVSISATGDHLISVDRGKDIELQNLVSGDEIVFPELPDLRYCSDEFTNEVLNTLSYISFNRLKCSAIVSNIEDSGVEDVYDFKVLSDDPPYGWVDGFLVHNCGESALLPFESCDLGSIDVSKFVSNGDKPAVDFKRLKTMVHDAVRFLDNVIDVNIYPIEQIKERTLLTRKIGLGVMGFADLLIQMGIPYGSTKAVSTARKLMKFVDEESVVASENLAKERGVFPSYKGSTWDEAGRQVRNATTTAIAPTGTISIIAGCSSGIEPKFRLVFSRNVLDGQELMEVDPYILKYLEEINLPVDKIVDKIRGNHGSVVGIPEIPLDTQRLFSISTEIPFEQHVKILSAFQQYTHNAVSKTISLPNSATESDVNDAMLLAWNSNCKGLTVYRDGSRRKQVIDSGEKSRVQPRALPKERTGKTERFCLGDCGDIYVTCNEDSIGVCEVFAHPDIKASVCVSNIDSLCIAISNLLRVGVSVDTVISRYRGQQCAVCTSGKTKADALSCADAISRMVEKVSGSHIKPLTMSLKIPKSKIEVCPDCSGLLDRVGGCLTCGSCGFSQCS